MKTDVSVMNKSVTVQLSKAAEQALAQRETPLYAEMELYFSCLIRLKVRFYDKQHFSNGVGVNDKLFLSFRPVMTQHCGKDYEGDEPPLTDFPIANPAAFVPKWIDIDFRNGQWQGEFGISRRQHS
ncbi:hypothetical protein [Kaarinaea lacus]